MAADQNKQIPKSIGTLDNSKFFGLFFDGEEEQFPFPIMTHRNEFQHDTIRSYRFMLEAVHINCIQTKQDCSHLMEGIIIQCSSHTLKDPGSNIEAFL